MIGKHGNYNAVKILNILLNDVAECKKTIKEMPVEKYSIKKDLIRFLNENGIKGIGKHKTKIKYERK